MALFSQIIRIEQVEAAWYAWQRQRKGSAQTSLWRVLCGQEGADSEALRELAAKIYGFQTFELKPVAATQFVRRNRDRFASEAWNRLIAHCIVPVEFELNKTSSDYFWSFATPDPTNPAIKRALDALGVGDYTLYYAPEAELVGVLVDALGAGEPQQEPEAESDEAPSIPFTDGASADSFEEPASETQPEQPRKPATTRESSIQLFESALQEAVRRGLPRAHFGTGPQDQVHIYLGTQHKLVTRFINTDISFEHFLRYLRSELHADGATIALSQPMSAALQRWINHKLVRCDVDFRPYLGPPPEVEPSIISVTVG